MVFLPGLIGLLTNLGSWLAIGEHIWYLPSQITGVLFSTASIAARDKFVTKTNSYGFESERLEFSEYVWTADKLPSFRSYRIKIVMTSNSQVYVPRMKDLRVIALA